MISYIQLYQEYVYVCVCSLVCICLCMCVGLCVRGARVCAWHVFEHFFFIEKCAGLRSRKSFQMHNFHPRLLLSATDSAPLLGGRQRQMPPPAPLVRTGCRPVSQVHRPNCLHGRWTHYERLCVLPSSLLLNKTLNGLCVFRRSFG